MAHLCSIQSQRGRRRLSARERLAGSPTRADPEGLAGQVGAVEREAVERAEYGGGNQVGLEEFASDLLDFFPCDRFDGIEDFIERVETLEIQLLPGEIGHPRARGLERKHQRALEMVLGAAQLLFCNGRLLEVA